MPQALCACPRMLQLDQPHSTACPPFIMLAAVRTPTRTAATRSQRLCAPTRSVSGRGVRHSLFSTAATLFAASASFLPLQARGAVEGPRNLACSATNGTGAAQMEVATVGGGCFWCIEAAYNLLQGVHSAISGYTGGHVLNPTYKQICTATTGHAEVVQVTYDPSIVTYEEILEILFTLHDPTTKDRQGNDVGPQYRSCIFYHNEAQKAAAEKVMQKVAEEKWFAAPLTTELSPLPTFYPAEDYHQQYYKLNPSQGYCRVVVGPKVTKFRQKYAARLK